ncbi:MAG: InlB B-repeat-containing protein [Treponema sp.]|nr:InlB B-repeat-containing protein [Candidatus Treponema merdequi]
MKNIQNLFIVLAVPFVMLASCNIGMDIQEEISQYVVADNNGENGSPYVQISLGNQSARTALPSLSVTEFSEFTLSIFSKYDTEYIRQYSFSTLDELSSAKIEVNEGYFVFKLEAVYDNVIYSDQKEIEVRAGRNDISFTLGFAGSYGSTYGRGSFEINALFPPDSKCVKAGLYSISGVPITGYHDIKLETFNNNQAAVYKQQNIPSGSYIVKFTFYGDEDATVYIGNIQEYVVVVKDKLSTSEIQLDDFSNVYSINYNLNNRGNFKEGEKPVVAYSRFSGIIMLPVPEPKNEKFEFIGWFAEKDFSGSPVTAYNSAQGANITFYAKWKTNKSAIFNGNGRTFTYIDKNGETQTVGQREVVLELKDSSTGYLPTAQDLGLSSIGKAFLYWVGNGRQYTDGEKITYKENDDVITLIAVYSPAEINPLSDSDKTDTDKDGLTDWQEIYVYHTDPNCDDTDGDGWKDGWEISQNTYDLNTFNPSIADLPNVTITLNGIPQIYRNYTVSTSKGESKQQTVSETSGTSFSNTNTDSSTQGMAHGWKLGGKIGKSKDGLQWEISTEVNGSYSSSATATVSNSQSKNWSTSISNGQTITETETQTNNGGKIVFPIRLTNNGNIAYALNSLMTSLSVLKSSGSVDQDIIGNFPKVAGVGGISIGTIKPQESMDLVLETDVNNAQLEKLLVNTRTMKVNVNAYDISTTINNQTNNFTGSLTSCNARCADLTIGFGPANPTMHTRQYKVSAKTKYNPKATQLEDVYIPLTLKEVLANVGIKENATSELSKLVLDANGRIKSIGGVESKGSNKDGDWYIMIMHKDINGNFNVRYYTNHVDPFAEDASLVNTSYNIADILIKPQDRIKIFYDVDKDNDGVSSSDELFYGTEDDPTKENCKDFDKDGVSDYEEIYGWKKSGNDKIFYTNPVDPDTDGDTIFYPNNVSAWNDANDPDPLTPSRTDAAGIKELKFTNNIKNPFLTVKTEKNDEDTYNISSLENEKYRTAYEYAYLQITPQFKGSKIRYKEVDIFTGQPTGNYKEYQTGETLEILLAAEKTNTILIQVYAPDGNEQHFHIYQVIAKSKYNEYTDLVTANSSSCKNLTITVPSYYDKRLTLGSNSGILIGLARQSIGDSISYSDIQNAKEAGTNVEYDNSVSAQYFKIPSSKLETSKCTFSFTTDSKVLKTYYRLFRYEIDHNDVKISPLTQSLSLERKTPKYGILTFCLDYLEDTYDNDSGAESEYYGRFHTKNIVFNNATLEGYYWEQSLDDDTESGRRYYSFRNNSRTGTKPIQFEEGGKKYTATFNISDLEKDGNQFAISCDIWEEDNCRDDWIGDPTIKFIYYREGINKDSPHQWFCVINGHATKDASFIIPRAGEGIGAYNTTGNNGLGKINIGFSVKWEYDFSKE